MENFPRGSLPPAAFEAIVREIERVEQEVVAGELSAPEAPAAEAAAPQSPRTSCDLATTCPTCGTLMQPEHAHYRCLTCGYRDSCCF